MAVSIFSRGLATFKSNHALLVKGLPRSHSVQDVTRLTYADKPHSGLLSVTPTWNKQLRQTGQWIFVCDNEHTVETLSKRLSEKSITTEPINSAMPPYVDQLSAIGWRRCLIDAVKRPAGAKSRKMDLITYAGRAVALAGLGTGVSSAHVMRMLEKDGFEPVRKPDLSAAQSTGSRDLVLESHFDPNYRLYVARFETESEAHRLVRLWHRTDQRIPFGAATTRNYVQAWILY